MLWLKQSTAVTVQFGPFLDKTDGVTLEIGLATALDSATTGIRLSKNGAALADRADATVPIYDAMGDYRVTLGTADTDTLGALRMIFEEAATTLPVWQDFMVVPANVYDSMFGADALDVSMIQINGNATAAIQLALSAAQIESGAAEGTPTTTVIQTDLAEVQNDIYIGRTVIFTSGAARGEASDITAYAGATGTITVTALANAPTAADTFILI